MSTSKWHKSAPHKNIMQKAEPGRRVEYVIDMVAHYGWVVIRDDQPMFTDDDNPYHFCFSADKWRYID